MADFDELIAKAKELGKKKRVYNLLPGIYSHTHNLIRRYKNNSRLCAQSHIGQARMVYKVRGWRSGLCRFLCLA